MISKELGRIVQMKVNVKNFLLNKSSYSYARGVGWIL